MSKTIDEKVVSLQFESQNFEKNVKSSMTLLEKFQNALKFKGAEKGFEDIEKAAEKADLSPIAKATVTVSDGFTAMERIAINVLSSIAIRAEQAGERILKSITIDQISSGYNKYEQKIASVQTLVNSTGKSIEDVNGYLDKLMWFADETSYSFSDMTSSLAQLTSSGGEADNLLPMIMGIANATAFAGKGVNEFSRAIYNLNQSYGSGALKYMDWKSLELAGVASKDLKQSFIDTAIELGTLDEFGRTANGTLVDIANFGQTLKENWADTSVMEATFGKFYQYTEMAYEMIQEGQFETASEAYRFLSTMYDDVYIKAARSAQEAKTFTEAIAATKDAVSTKWMTTFDTIFGNYDQAKETWTNLANDFWEIFASGGDTRNEILAKAFKDDYSQLKTLFNLAGQDFDEFDKKYTDSLRAQGYNIDELIKQYGSLNNAISNNAIMTDALGHTTGIGSNLKKYLEYTKLNFVELEKSMIESGDVVESMQTIFDNVWKGVYGNGEERVRKLTEANLDYATVQNFINKLAKENHRAGYKLLAGDVEHLTDEELKNIGVTREQAGVLSDTIQEVSESTADAQEQLEHLMSGMGRKSGQVLLSKTISNLTQTIIALQEVARGAWATIFDVNFSDVIYNALERIYEFTNGIRETIENSTFLKSSLEFLFQGIKIVGNAFSLVHEVVRQLITGGLNVLSTVFENINIDVGDFSTTITEALDKAVTWLQDNEVIIGLVETAAGSVVAAYDKIKEWLSTFVDFESLSTSLSNVAGSLEELVSNNLSLEKFQNIFTNIVESIKNGNFDPFGALAASVATFSDSFKTNFGTIITSVTDSIKLTEDQITGIRNAAQYFIEMFIGLGSGWFVLSGLKKIIDVTYDLVAPIKSLRDVMDAFAGVGYEAAKYIKQMKANLVVNNILKIAISVGILTAALYAFQKMGGDPDAMWTAIKATAALMGIILAFMVVLTLLSNKQIKDGPLIKANLTEIAKLILAVAANLFILAIAFKIMDGVNPATIGYGFMVFAALITVMAMAAKWIARDGETLIHEDKKIKALSKTLLSISAAMFIMALAIARLDKIEYNHPIMSLGALAAMIVAFTYACKALKGLDRFSGLTFLAFAFSINSLVNALEKISKFKIGDYWRGLIRLLPIFIALALVIKGAKALAKEGGAFSAVFVVGIATAIFGIALSVEKLGKLDIPTLWKGGIAASALFTVISLIGSAVGVIGGLAKGTIRSAIATSIVIISAAASLYVMAGAIMLFKNLPEEDIKKSVNAITKIFFAIGAMFALIGLSGLFGKNANSYQVVGSMTRLIILVGVIAIAVAALAGIAHFDSKALNAAIGGLVAIFISLGVLLVCMSSIKDVAGMLTQVTAVVAILAAVGAVIYVLTQGIGNAQKAISVAEAMSKIMLSVAGAIFVVSIAASVSQGLTSVGSVMMALSGFVGIILAISGLIAIIETVAPDSSGPIQTALQNMVNVVTLIGEVLGGFVGGVFKGLTTELISALIDPIKVLADNIKEFAGAMNIISQVKFPDNFGDTIKSITDILGAFGSNFVNITNLSTLSDNMPKLQEFFFKFGSAVKAFGLSTRGIDPTTLGVAATAGTMFAQINDSFAKNGGRGLLTDNLSKFAERMTDFGKGLVGFSAQLGFGFRADLVNSAIPTIKELMSVEGNLEDSQSFFGYLVGGTKDLGDFGNRLSNFGAGLVLMSQSLEGFNPDSVDVAVDAGKVLSTFEKTLTSSPTLMGYFGVGGESNTSMGDFGNRIRKFCEGLKEGLQAIAELGKADLAKSMQAPDSLLGKDQGETLFEKINYNVDKIVEISGKFADLESQITGESTGTLFSDNSTLGTFGAGLKNFALAFKEFSDNFPEDMPSLEQIQAMLDITDLLLNFDIASPEEAAGKPSAFTSLYNTFKDGISQTFENVTSDIDVSNVKDKIQSIATDILSGDSVVSEFVNSGKELGTSLMGSVGASLSDLSLPERGQIVDGVKSIASEAVDTASSFYKDHIEVGKNNILGEIEGLMSKKQDFLDAIYEVQTEGVKVAKNVWKEKSPSKVAYEIGSFFTLGLAYGISDSTEEAVSSVTFMAESVSNAVQSAMDASDEILENQFYPVITPVLDTSDVQSGASSISDMLNSQKSYEAMLGIQASRFAENQNGAQRALTVNVDFTINQAGNDLSEVDFTKFGKQIAKVVNDELGKMVA